MAQIKLAEYTFDNSLGDCLPKFTGISTSNYTYEDTVNDNITTRIIYTTSTKTITRISFTNKTSLLTVSYLINTKYASDMFKGCANLISINIPDWNITGATSYENMFYGCNKLESLDLSSFTATNLATNMGTMFSGCKSLTYLNLSSFDTSNLTTANAMFSGCTSLKELDLTSFDTSNITNSKYMFESWSSSQKVYISSKWTLGTNFSPTFIIAFANIIAKYKFDQNTYANFLPTFNTEFTDYIYTDEIDTDGYTIRTLGNDSSDLPTLMMFGTDSAGSLLELFECNTSQLTDMSDMFYGCSNLTSLNLSCFNTEKVTDMNYMFGDCSCLTSLDFSSFNTQKVTDMSNMFRNCWGLTSLNLSSFDTQNVANMNYMFGECSGLTSLDISSFNTQNVLIMTNIFYNCSSLTSLNLSSFNTEKLTSMSYMFYGCESLTSLNLSSFNTEKVTNMSHMFRNCTSLTSLNLSSFNTEKLSNMTGMFRNCSSLTSLDLTNFNTQKVSSITYLFGDWTSSQKVYISPKWTLGRDFPPTFIIAFAYTIAKYKFNQNIYESFIPTFNDDFTDYTYNDETDTDGYTIRILGNDSGNLPTLMRFGQEWITGESDATDKSKSLLEVYECDTSNITNMNDMFRYCNNLISLVASNFNTSKATSMSQMFQNCTSLVSLDLSSFNTSQVTNMGYMFQNCSSLTSLNVSNFNTQNVINMVNMFTNCSKLTSLDVSSFNVSQVRNMTYMFAYCSSLTSLDLSNFNTINATGVNSMFANCSALTSLDLSNFNTEKVDNMTTMFNKCSSLTSLDLSSFNTDKVANMSFMFQSCSSLTSLNISSFNTSQVTTMNSMFNGCSSLTSLDVSNFNTDKVSNMTYMFSNCSSLTSLDLSNFDTGNVTSMNYMFYHCDNLTSLDLSSFNTEKVADMSRMFSNCLNLISLNLSSFNTEKVTDIRNMFYNCSKLTSLDVSNFNTEKVVNMSQTFDNCSSLTSLDVSNFNTEKVTSMISMFNNCSSLTSLDISNFNIQSITTTTDMLVNTPLLTNIGAIYCNSDTINKISDLITTDMTIWYSDAKPEDLAKKSNITYKEYKMNILESDEEIELRSNGDVYDELNLLTGELTQRIDENGEILTQEIIKTINLKGKPSIDWQGDTYFYLENNTLYPQLDCEIESINYYEIPKLKANTLYTLRYVGEPTECIFGGLTYETENNMILTSGSSDNLLYFDKEVRKVVLIEGDVRDRNFDYFEGIESLGAVEIITHKSDMSIFSKVQLPPHIQLHRLPDGTCDELDIKTGILTRRIDENYNLLEKEITEKLILNYNNSCNYGLILPKGASDNYNVITNEYKQNINFISIDGSITFDTATIKDTTVKYSIALSKFDVDATNIKGDDGIYCDNNLFKYEASDNDYEHAYIENDTTLHIYVNKSRLSSYDQVGFQLYLIDNPFDLYYAMRNPIISYVNYEDLDSEKASWEMLDCTEGGSITIESGNMDKDLLSDCMDYIAPTKNRFEIDLLKPNTQYTVYVEGVSGEVQLNFGGNTVDFTSGNIYTSGETQLVEFYTDSEIKNLIIIEGDTRNETINFFEGLKSSENITVISSNSDENKSNKISYEGITLRSLPNGVKDEINVLTGEYIQRIDITKLNGSENWDNGIEYTNTFRMTALNFGAKKNGALFNPNGIKADSKTGDYEHIRIDGDGNIRLSLSKERLNTISSSGFKSYLSNNPITIQYELAEPIIHQLDLQTLTAYQDGYISMEVEANFPSLIYSLPSTNTFYVPRIKNRTQYTLKYPTGKGIVTIGGIQYNITSDSMLFTTPIEIANYSFVFETDDNPTEVMIFEGNYSDKEIKYFTGINSVINPIIKVTNNLTGDSVEYKGDSNIALYSLPNKMSDKLNILSGYLTRVTGIREYQDGDYELDNVYTDGINTVYELDSPLLYGNVNFPIPTLNGYGTIELDSDEVIPQFNYRVLSSNYYPLELLELNTTYTMVGEAQADTTFTLGGTYVGNYSGGKVVVNLGNVTEKSLKFSDDIGLKNFMLVKDDATNSTLPFYTGIKSVEDITFNIKGFDGQENSLVLDNSIVLRKCGNIYDSIDLVNGVMTKQLNEIILTGTENWSIETSKKVDSNYQLFKLTTMTAKDSRGATIYCDKLIHKYLGNNTDCIYFENNKLYLCINKHTIGGDNVNALKAWLIKNNITIIYPLINSVKINLDTVWEVVPPISYETQTEFDSNVALDSLKPILAVTVATTTLEEIVSDLNAKNKQLEAESLVTMLAVTEVYEMIYGGATTMSLKDSVDSKPTVMSINEIEEEIEQTPMGKIYVRLIKAGMKTIEQVPYFLQEEVIYYLNKE